MSHRLLSSLLALAAALVTGGVPSAGAAPIPPEQVEIERPDDAPYRVGYLYLQATRGDAEYALDRLLVTFRGDGVVGGLVPLDVTPTDASDLTLKHGKLTGTITTAPLGERRDKNHLYTLDARIADDGRITGTFRFATEDRKTREGGGELTGVVKTAEQLREEQAFTRGPQWPVWQGPTQDRESAPSDAELVDSLADARLVWKSEATIPGAPGRSGGLVRKAMGVPTTPVTGGGATPIIAEDRAFLRYAIPSGEVFDKKAMAALTERYGPDFENRAKIKVAADDVVLALDARTGEMVWKTTLENAGLNFQEHKQSQNNLTAAYHEGKVFAVGSTLRLYALDAGTGEVLWQSDLGGRHEEIERIKAEGMEAGWYRGALSFRDFGFAPTIIDGKLIVSDGRKTLLAFDPATGERLWQKEGVVSNNATPVPWNHGGKAYLVSIDGKQAHVLDASDGSELYSVPTNLGKTAAVVDGDLLAVREGAAEGDDDDEEGGGIWVGYRLSPEGAQRLYDIPAGEFSSYNVPVIEGGRLFLSGRGVNGMYDSQTGKLLAKTGGTGVANAGHLQWADGRLIVRPDGKHGTQTFAMFEAGKDSLKQLGDTWEPAHPQTTSYGPYMFAPIVDGRLFVRGADAIYLYDLRKSAARQRQAVRFKRLEDRPLDAASVMLRGEATSGLPVSFRLVDGPATLEGDVLELTGEPGVVTVAAVQGGDSSWQAASEVVRSFAVGDPTPAVPSEVAATPIASSVARVVWEHPGPFAQGFAIERAAGGADGEWHRVASVDADARRYTDRGLEKSTAYRYRVTARNDRHTSQPSPPVAVKTLAADHTLTIEAESGRHGEHWQVHADDRASGGRAVEAERLPPDKMPEGEGDTLTLTFDWPVGEESGEGGEQGEAAIWFRTRATTGGGSDSLHFRLDDGEWRTLGFNPDGHYHWTRYHLDLGPGRHTLTLGIREKDARVDRLFITNGEQSPDHAEADATAATADAQGIQRR